MMWLYQPNEQDVQEGVGCCAGLVGPGRGRPAWESGSSVVWAGLL